MFLNSCLASSSQVRDEPAVTRLYQSIHYLQISNLHYYPHNAEYDLPAYLRRSLVIMNRHSKNRTIFWANENNLMLMRANAWNFGEKALQLTTLDFTER